MCGDAMEVPESTARFLERYADGLRGVVSSGSFHWGAHFARAGEQISGRYGVPLVAKLNKSGSEADAQVVAPVPENVLLGLGTQAVIDERLAGLGLEEGVEHHLIQGFQ